MGRGSYESYAEILADCKNALADASNLSVEYFFLETSGYLLTMLVALFLWRFAFRGTSHEAFGGYSEQEMMLYLLIAGLITSTLWFTAQGDRLASDIRDGRITRHLIKPYSIHISTFIAVLSGKVLQFFFSTVVVLVIALSLHIPFAPTLNAMQIVLFAIFFVVAMVIQWLILTTVAFFAFWMDEVWGQLFVVRVFADVAAGTFLPLSLFAPFWQRIFGILPFKYIVSVPVNVLMGRIGSAELLPTFGGAVVWLAILFLLAHIALRRGIRRYSAVGG